MRLADEKKEIAELRRQAELFKQEELQLESTLKKELPLLDEASQAEVSLTVSRILCFTLHKRVFLNE